MSKWSKLKAAMLAATSVVAALQFGGCLNFGALDWETVVRLATIGSIFD